jgi:hypothetical protein
MEAFAHRFARASHHESFGGERRGNAVSLFTGFFADECGPKGGTTGLLEPKNRRAICGSMLSKCCEATCVRDLASTNTVRFARATKDVHSQVPGV